MFGLSVLQYQEVLERRKELYYIALASGEITPFIWPWDTLPVLYLFFALLLGPRLKPRIAKLLYWVTFIAINSHLSYVYAQRRTLGFASGYGIGLSMTWGIIISGVLLLVSDGARSYARLELRRITSNPDKSQEPSSTQSGRSLGQTESDLRKRYMNGAVARKEENINRELHLSQDKQYRIVWQTFPSSLYHSIDWTLDLVTSFRGPNWNFRVSTLPPIDAPELPDDKSKAIKLTHTINTDRTKTVLPTGPQTLSRTAYDLASIKNTMILYLSVDILKNLMITDPYFLGIAPLTTPTPWLFLHSLHHKLTSNPYLPLSISLDILTRTARLTVGLLAIISCLALILSLCPLFFHTIIPRLLPLSLHKITLAPLSEQWLYAPFFTPPFPTIATHGLAGFWGKCWHQMFRYGISEPSPPILRRLKIDPKSQTGRFIQLLVAFTLTGILHCVASYTTFSIIPSRPLGPLVFFPLQALGITFQTLFSAFIGKTLGIKLPKAIRYTANTVFVVVWGYWTAPLLVDDFARCGVWLFEPLPVSFVRPLLGGKWWCWETLGEWVGLWPGVEGRRDWWDRGIAFF